DMKLNDFNNLTNFGIEDPRMTTIGGVAFRHLDRLPKIGDSISVEGITITVLEMDEHRIAHVRVSRGGVAEEEAASGSAAAEPDDEASPGADAGGSASGFEEDATPARDADKVPAADVKNTSGADDIPAEVGRHAADSTSSGSPENAGKPDQVRKALH
ncbi:MAG: transporter associated domain-containing protein, partial [Gammaproteobacteria bacterium]